VRTPPSETNSANQSLAEWRGPWRKLPKAGRQNPLAEEGLIAALGAAGVNQESELVVKLCACQVASATGIIQVVPVERHVRRANDRKHENNEHQQKRYAHRLGSQVSA
jgi:hypothetical protein